MEAGGAHPCSRAGKPGGGGPGAPAEGCAGGEKGWAGPGLPPGKASQAPLRSRVALVPQRSSPMGRPRQQISAAHDEEYQSGFLGCRGQETQPPRAEPPTVHLTCLTRGLLVWQLIAVFKH